MVKRKYSKMSAGAEEKKYNKKKKVVPYVPRVPRYYLNPSNRRDRVEKKFIDTYLPTGTLYNLAGTWQKTLLNGVTLGTDENTRIGREIVIKSIYLRGMASVVSTTTGYGSIRTMLVLDVQPNAATFTTTDCFTVDNFLATQNLNNRKRFKVLWDDVCQLYGSNAGLAVNDKENHHMYFYKKKRIPVEFNSVNGGTIGDITRGALYLCTCTDGAVTTTKLGVTPPDSNFNIRVRFID